MRIAYVAHWNVSHENGVAKKMADQVRFWRSVGHQAELFVLSPGSTVWDGLNDLDVRLTEDKGYVQRLLRTMKQLVDAVMKWNPDVVYLRFDTYYPAIERLLRRIPTVLEINTDDINEYRMEMSRPKYLYHRLLRGRVLSNATGMVFVTRELAAKFRSFQKPMAVIGNSIDLSNYPHLPAPENSVPRLVFIGTPGQTWHGIDKIAVLAKRFPTWHFDLIGVDTGLETLPNVQLHGLLGRSQYTQLIAQADAAIGTLALHRKGMGEACPLKVREYLAHGIPVIIGCEDTDFPEAVPFLLRLENSERNIIDESGAIEAFVSTWQGRRVMREVIHRLDVQVKEQERLDFFARIVSGRTEPVKVE